MKSKAIYLSRFTPNVWGHGGEKRSAQLFFHFNSNYTLIEFNIFNSSFKNKLYSLFNAIHIVFKYNLGIQNLFNVKFLQAVNFYFQNLKYYKNECNILVTEDTITINKISVYIAKLLKYEIIIFPHNIESLVPMQLDIFSKKKSPNSYLDDLKLYSLANKVYTISREENWLLRLYNINSFYFPYVLDNKIELQCQEIKHRRKETNKNGILLLSTYSNSPSLKGAVEVINLFLKYGFETKLIIAGFDADYLYDYFNKFKFKILSNLSNECYINLLTEIACIVIHQVPTSGSLTKIKELVACGIKVYCNINAARDHFDVPELTIYEDFDEIIPQLQESS